MVASRPNAGSLLIIRQLVNISAARWQAGVLRKLSTTSPMWISRLSEGRSWEDALAAWEREMTPKEKPENALSGDVYDELARKGMPAVVAELKKLGPCGSSTVTQDDMWKIVERAVSITSNEAAAASRKILFDIMTPNMKNAVDRAGRLAVERELTLEILRLRQSKEQDPKKRWPESPGSFISQVCPSYSYAYRSDEEGMEIRFDGTIAGPTGAPFLLPLSFRSAYPKKEMTPPEPPPALTPTPAGGMIGPP